MISPGQRTATFRGRAAQLLRVLSDVLDLTSQAAAFIKYLVYVIDIYVGGFNVSSLNINPYVYDLKLNRYYPMARNSVNHKNMHLYSIYHLYSDGENCLFKDFPELK